MVNSRNDVKKLPTRKTYLKLATILVQICLVYKVFMVPSDRISQNVGSKSNYFRKKLLKYQKKKSTTMLAISNSSDDLCLHKKIKENINGRANFVIVVVVRWASFYRIFDRQNVPASDISKIGRFGPGFKWTKCRSIFWKENSRIFDQLLLSFFSARTFLTGDLAIL